MGGSSFDHQIGRARREMDRDFKNREREENYPGTGVNRSPYYSPAAREVEIAAGNLVLTTWGKIFSELTICNTCARVYPDPEMCPPCEKAMDEGMKAPHFLAKEQTIDLVVRKPRMSGYIVSSQEYRPEAQTSPHRHRPRKLLPRFIGWLRKIIRVR